MIDITSFNKALKSIWIKKYLDGNNCGKWKLFFDSELEQLGGSIVFSGNLNLKDTKRISKTCSPFLKELLEIWSEVNFQGTIQSVDTFLNQHLWHNSLITIMDKSIFYKNWYEIGILDVNHLIEERPNVFMSLLELENKHHTKVCALTYYGIISAIKDLWKKQGLTITPNNPKEQATFLTTFQLSKMANKLEYQKLIKEKLPPQIPSQKKWTGIFQETQELNWADTYTLAAKCTRSTKLIEFQFRFLHQTLTTNVSFVKMSFKEGPSCTFCQSQQEDLPHIFWFCKMTECFWKNIVLLLKQLNYVSSDYTLDALIALDLRPNSFEDQNQTDFIFLLARFFIWLSRSKQKNPVIENFSSFLKQYKKVAEPLSLEYD